MNLFWGGGDALSCYFAMEPPIIHPAPDSLPQLIVESQKAMRRFDIETKNRYQY